MSCKDFKWDMQFKDFNNGGLEERELAEEYIISIEMQELLQNQEQKYWAFRNYSTKNKGSHNLRMLVYKIHTEEFKKALRGIK